MEIIIIGAGPGGYAAAIYAAKRGISVTLIERDQVGGTCLNRGCIPTKTILHSANLFHRAKSFAGLGINVSVQGTDYSRIHKRCDEVVGRLRGGVEFLLSKAGVNVIRGEAALTDGRHVKVTAESGELMLSADHIVIAVGAVPAAIPVAPLDGHTIMNSDHALALTELPESMTIIGGGVIGCEFAQAFARLGSKVTVIEAMPRLLPEVDEDISGLLYKVLRRDGVDVHLNSRVTETANTANGVRVRFVPAQRNMLEVCSQKALVAVGRRPDISRLGLERAGVTHSGGFIQVNNRMQTNIPGIYAIGDVTGGVQLAHAASFDGIAAIRHMLGEASGTSADFVPMCVYTDPEVACVGMTQNGAAAAGIEYKTGTFPLSANARAVIEGAADGFAKVVLDSDGTLVGAHLAGPNVTEMISLLGGLISFQTAAADMEEIMFAHPSVSECIGESVMAAYKMSIHIP